MRKFAYTRSLLAVLVLALAVAACGGDTGASEDDGTDAAATAEPSGTAAEDTASEPEDAASEPEDAASEPEDAASEAAAAPAPEGDPIRIGSVFGFSGAVAQSGTEMVNGIEIAVDQLNEEGGILGRPVELVLEDDGNEPQQSVSSLQRVLSEDVVAFVGSSGSPTATPMMEILQGGIPSIMALASDPNLAALGYENILLFNNPAGQKEQPLVDYVGSLEEVETVAMILQNNDYAKGIAALYEEQWADGAGPEIVYTGYFQNDQADYSSLVARAQSEDPDALYILGFTEQYQRILSQAAGIGFEPDFTWMSGESINPYSLDLDAAIIEGVYAAAVFNPYSEDPVARQFSERYQEEHGIAPGYFAATTYDSMMYMAAAIEAAGTADDPDAIIEALRSTEHTGVRGEVVLNEDGQVLLESRIVRVVDGALTDVDG